MVQASTEKNISDVVSIYLNAVTFRAMSVLALQRLEALRAAADDSELRLIQTIHRLVDAKSIKLLPLDSSI
jgi:hypothetical protein